MSRHISFFINIQQFYKFFNGFAHVNTFFAWIFGFIFSGFLLARYCPEPTTLAPELQLQHAAALAGQGPMPEVYANAHYLWLAYAGVGIVSLIALLLFMWATRRIDARAAIEVAGR